ncbi:NAD(P)-dependent oxidoreductase [Roseivirga sp. E12]|uniref:NAD-dependent epimerase/dehydratase family protein n=1 Tax=Roseivirga sp. E12 TaxID=2819237 RepID=UPI001ABC859B|nr:NAD-dependent epimerase/dehydratase family protein [Roseivirga sp. E12]MBO3699736.1 NAD-dependent epimerase/dehydratase family protein [Roseivirga sp. E12]
MKQSIIITGVAGLIGSRMADWIVKHYPEYEVVGIDDLSGGYRENVVKQVTFYQMDCADGSLKEVFEKHDPLYVFHFAAYAAEGLSPFIRKFNYQSNLIATANIINECIRSQVKRLVFTSSMAVYGRGTPPFDEEDQPAPIDPYGIAKYACELDIKVAAEQHGLDWCIIRPHNVYGINQNIWDSYRNVLGIWMLQNMTGQPMTIFGDGSQKRAFSSIDDCLKPLWNAATYDGASKQIINLGSAIEYSIKDAAEILKEVMGSGELLFLEQRHEVKDAHPTWQKSIELLNFEDKTNLHTGLSIMWEWAKQLPKRDRFVWSSYELERGLYGFWKSTSLSRD